MIDAGPVAVAIALEAALAADAFPGGVLVVADHGTIVLRRAFGQRARPPYPGAGAAVTLDTVYDAASVTKAAATMTVLLRLAAAGKVDLDAPAQRWLPELGQPGAEAIRVWHMCAHAAGFIWWLPFHERIAQGDRDAVLRQIGQAPLERPPGSGSVYSDLSFISLGFLCERAGGARLDALHRTLVTAPLGLEASLGFRPLGEAATTDGAVIAPTEHCPRRGLLIGEVHDDNAHRLGGVAGHAGLFARAEALVELGLALAAAHEGAASLFDRALVRRCFAPAGVPGSTWRIGWDGPAPVVPGATTPSSQVGDRVARSAVMHLGFTGCSWVIDPPRGRVIALLTNRVHPTRETQIYREHRPRIHDAVIAALDGG